MMDNFCAVEERDNIQEVFAEAVALPDAQEEKDVLLENEKEASIYKIQILMMIGACFKNVLVRLT